MQAGSGKVRYVMTMSNMNGQVAMLLAGAWLVFAMVWTAWMILKK